MQRFCANAPAPLFMCPTKTSRRSQRSNWSGSPNSLGIPYEPEALDYKRKAVAEGLGDPLGVKQHSRPVASRRSPSGRPSSWSTPSKFEIVAGDSRALTEDLATWGTPADGLWDAMNAADCVLQAKEEEVIAMCFKRRPRLAAARHQRTAARPDYAQVRFVLMCSFAVRAVRPRASGLPGGRSDFGFIRPEPAWRRYEVGPPFTQDAGALRPPIRSRTMAQNFADTVAESRAGSPYWTSHKPRRPSTWHARARRARRRAPEHHGHLPGSARLDGHVVLQCRPRDATGIPRRLSGRVGDRPIITTCTL